MRERTLNSRVSPTVFALSILSMGMAAELPPASVPLELKARIEALEQLATESPTDMAV